MTEIRKLKVYHKSSGSGKDIPMIHLQGSWIEKYGFKPGDYIAVECNEKKLSIIPREPDEKKQKVLEDRIEKLTPAQRKKVSAALDKMGL